MRRRMFILSAAAACIAPAHAQTLEDLIRGAGAAAGQGGAGKGGFGLPKGVSALEGESALRQALTNGAIAAVLKVGKLDGFWRDGKIQIPLPNTLAKVQSSLKPMGLSAPLDDLHLKINRAAETAAPQARKLFTDAIKGMSVQDVAGVLRGGERAGTTYLREKTGAQLSTLFRPPVAAALESSGAMQAFDGVAKRYGAQAFLGDKPRASFTDFAVGKGLDGVFFYVGEEEAAIRKDPAKRTTQLLKKVFGGL